MRYTYFTVGPTQLYKTVPRHIATGLKNDIAEISHRGSLFKQIYEQTTGNLRKLLRIPRSHHIFFVGSSLESMERTIQSTVEKYSYHLVYGEFSKKLYQTAVDYGKSAEMLEVPAGKGFSFEQIRVPKKTEIVAITQNETSTGAAIPVQMIYQLKKNSPNTLTVLDVVSSIPYLDLNYKLIDVAFFSSQKGFGLPAGLGVLIVSPAAVEKARYLKKKGVIIGGYHNFLSLADKEAGFQTPETPNVLNIYLLSKVTEDLLKAGIEKIRKETEQKASLIYSHFDRHQEFSPFVKEPLARSKTTIAIDVKGKTKDVLAVLKKQGFVAGSGYGPFKETHTRIANFPSHAVTDVMKLLRAF